MEGRICRQNTLMFALVFCFELRARAARTSGWHRAFDELSFGEFAQESSAFFGAKKCENCLITFEVIWICYDRA